MESIKKQLLKRILPLILSLVIIFTSSVYPEKKVKAEALTLTFVAVTVIAGIIISGLAASGAISGDYTVSAPDLSAIQEKAQANLQAAGANAVEQANRLGEALKSGAESAKIKALASGAVIYAFLQAIQDVLAPEKTFADVQEGVAPGSFADYLANPLTKQVGMVGQYAIYIRGISPFFTAPPSYYWDSSRTTVMLDRTQYYIVFPNFDLSAPYEYTNVYIVVYDTVNDLFYDETKDAFLSGLYWLQYHRSVAAPSKFIRFDIYNEDSIKNSVLKMVFSALAGQSIGYNAVLQPETFKNIASAPSVTLPTVLPQTIINNITNWDGTSDLVLAPPLPYDIPTGEDLVIDPSYVGEGTVDPPKPTTDPDNPPSEEEGITLPWLAALLGLLGLGQLTGIDEGVKSGIDNLVDSITNTAQDVYDGVRDWADTVSSTIAQGIEGVRAKLGEIAGAITGGLALGIESIQSALGSIAETLGHAFDPPSKNVDWDKLKNIQLFNKFPFSIPSDLYYLFGLVAADPVAPCVKIPFDMTFLGGENIDATVDLATYDNVAAIIRNFEFIAFVIGMLYLTKSLIWK